MCGISYLLSTLLQEFRAIIIVNYRGHGPKIFKRDLWQFHQLEVLMSSRTPGTYNCILSDSTNLNGGGPC